MNTTYILEAIRHNSEVFIKNLEKIQNHSLSMDGFEKWIEPLMAALESMRNPNPETYDIFYKKEVLSKNSIKKKSYKSDL